MMADGNYSNHSNNMAPSQRDETENNLKKLREWFRSLDTNEDGKLNWKEFQRMIDSFGIELNFDELKKAYNAVDQNQDGRISFREFLDKYVKEQIQTKDLSVPGYHPQAPRKGVRYTRSQTDGPLYSQGSRSNHDCPQSLDGCKKLSDNQFNEGSQYFWKSDKDGDGKLSVTEFAHMLSTLGLKPSIRDVNKAFKMADEDSDGYVSFEEFANTYLMKIKTNNQRSTTNNRGTTVFVEHDIGKKGFLTKQECCKALRTLGNSINEKTLDKLMKIVNKGYDGKISFDDFNIILGSQDCSM